MSALPSPGVLDLDGRALALLVAVHECGSVTGAALRLGLSQSAVSHALERLRALLGDALFVKSGRGIVPTARADALLPMARDLLAQLQRLAEPAVVEPARLSLTWTVAANDLQAGLLLPAWLDAVRAQAPGVRLRVIPSSVPTLELLRDEQCQLVISPRPPEGDDVVQKRLYGDGYRVFFDAAGPAGSDPVPDRAAYEAAEHVGVEYGLSRRRLDIDRWLAEQGVQRRVVATVPAFAGLAAFLRGSARLATVPSLLGRELLAGLASAPLPFDAPELPMYAIWHRRHQHDALHRWLRGLLDEVVATTIGAGAGTGFSRAA